jgi:hypothetical protein
MTSAELEKRRAEIDQMWAEWRRGVTWSFGAFFVMMAAFGALVVGVQAGVDMTHPILQVFTQKGAISVASWFLIAAPFCNPKLMRACIFVAGAFLFIYAGWV